MCDINRHNFLESYDSIKTSIEESKFISIDCEFTGLVENPLYKNSLFDSSEERYLKLKEATHGFIIIQIGFTTFKYVPQENLYESRVFNFQLCPRWFGSDEKILLQPSCLVFLCAHKFDFNEMIYNGISYLSESEQNLVRTNLKEDSWFTNIEHPFLGDDEREIQNVCSSVARWLLTSSEEDSTAITLQWKDDTYVMNYVLLYEIVHRFLDKGICAYFRANQIHVERFNTEDPSVKQSRELLQNELLQTAKSQAWRSMMGFSAVFQLLVEARKPLIGHNLLTDLLFMYKQFHRPLPTSLSRFKAEVNRLFPTVYDTKYLSYEVNSRLVKGQKWDSNGLSELYAWLRDRTNITHLLLFVPQVKLMDDLSVSTAQFHTAGWDSYFAGFCFVHLIYILSSLKHSPLPPMRRPFTLSDQLASARPLQNKVNLIRAHLNHVNLAGPDPKSRRPSMILVRTRDRKRIVLDEVAEMFADYGSVDVRYKSYDSALVAVGNHMCARISQDKLKNHPLYHISTYKSRRELLVRTIYTLGFVSTVIGGISLYLLFSRPRL